MPKPNAPRLHLDEHMSKRLARQVRRHEFDITSSQEMGMLKTTDDQQLAYAVAERRAIVTSNFGDYTRLCEEYALVGREHWGIILTTQEPIQILTRRLLGLLNSFTDEELKNQLLWLNNFDWLL